MKMHARHFDQSNKPGWAGIFYRSLCGLHINPEYIEKTANYKPVECKNCLKARLKKKTQ